MGPNEFTVLVVFAYVTIAWLKTVSSGNVTVMDVLWGMGLSSLLGLVFCCQTQSTLQQSPASYV